MERSFAQTTTRRIMKSYIASIQQQYSQLLIWYKTKELWSLFEGILIDTILETRISHICTSTYIYLWGQTRLQNGALLLAGCGHVTSAPGQWGRGVLLTEFTLLYHRSVGRGAPSRPHVTQCDAVCRVTMLWQLWHVTRDGSARVPRRPGGGARPRHAGHGRARRRGQDRAHQQILQWHFQWGKHSLSLTQTIRYQNASIYCKIGLSPVSQADCIKILEIISIPEVITKTKFSPSWKFPWIVIQE